MGVKKTYDLAATKVAIDRANNMNINSLKMVRSDVSVTDWGRKHIKVAQRNPNVSADLQFPGQKDVGHTFRHVEGTHVSGKSLYVDEQTAIAVTSQLLNSDAGQAALGKIDSKSRDLYDNTTQRIKAAVTGHYFGKLNENGLPQKVTHACCEVMALGSDHLWVHSSYPVFPHP